MKTDKFQNKYRIPSARAAWHDYNGGDYFVRICTADRNHYFGEIRNGEMEYSTMGRCAEENLQHINSHYPYCQIPLYVVMPNHIHMIVVIDGSCRDAARHVSMGKINKIESDAARHVSTGKPTETSESTDAARHVSTNQYVAQNRGLLSVAIGGFKSAVTKYANLNMIKFGWQTRFHDRIIRDQDEMNQIAT